MKKFLENLENKEFYKKNWHRFLVTLILFFGIFFSSTVYLISAGFYVIFYVSLLMGFILSIMFAINYNKHYFFGLVFIVLLQIITVNIDTKKYQHRIYRNPIGQHIEDGDKYFKINASCFGFKRNYYESTSCVGKMKNCSIETFNRANNELINKEVFSCTEYDKITKEKENLFLKK